MIPPQCMHATHPPTNAMKRLYVCLFLSLSPHLPPLLFKPYSSTSSMPKTSISVLTILSNSALPIPTVFANRNKLLISVLTNCLTPTSALVISAASTSNLSTLPWLLGLVGLGALSSENVVLASRPAGV